ncbi:MAG: alanine racemase [Hyphomicrobiaceae bacterium]|nr:alanine racemase [Hyphomicrobiaceae bacterium]
MAPPTSDIADALAHVPAAATGAVVVDLAALERNWRALAGAVAPALAAAVVKADAYGLGAEAVVPALARAGCTVYFVATLAEARQVLALAPTATVLVLDGLMPGAAAAYAECGAWPVLSSLPEIVEWSGFARATGRRLACAMHVDSGLNRLGLDAREVQALARDMHLIDPLDVRLVMSHLACADEVAHAKNGQQLAVLERLLPLLPSVPVSLAASDGLLLGAAYHFDMARPGYALYGGQASPSRHAPVEPVVSVHARVVQVREVAPGQSVGYAATWTARRLSRIAVIAAGYADGLPRQMSAADGEAGGSVAFGGVLAPIVGRVSMDLVTADVTDLGDLSIARGTWAELIGPAISLEAAGAAAGTIGYEILTRLPRRFHRVYRGTGP